MSNDDTTRRKRAEESLLSEDWKWSDEDYEWAHGFSLNAYDRGFLHGHLAGASEEAAINAAEITDLRQEVGNLQRAIRWYHGYDEPGTSSFPLCLDGPRYGWRSVARSEFPCVRRALEAKS